MSGSKSTTTSTTTLPDWVTNESKTVINHANDIADAGYPTYTGELVAGMNNMEKSAADAQYNNANNYKSTLNSAGNTLSSLQSYLENAGVPSYSTIMSYANNGQSPSTSQIANLYGTTNQVNGQAAINATDTSKNTQVSNAYNGMGGVSGIASGDYANSGASTWNTATAEDYMNPYVAASLNPQIKLLQQQLAAQQNTINGQASQANAFGDSRQAVASALANQTNDLSLNSLISSGYNTAYGDALSAYNSDNANKISAYNQGLSAGNTLLGTLASQQANNASLALQGVNSAASIDSQNYQNQLKGLTDATSANQAQEALNLQGVSTANTTQSNYSSQLAALAAALQQQSSQIQSQANTATASQYAAGQAYQNQQQAVDNASYQQFLNALNYQQTTLADQEAALAAAKYGTTTTSTTKTSSDPLSSALGAFSTITGGIGSLMTGGIFGSGNSSGGSTGLK